MSKQLLSQTACLVQSGRLTECIQQIQKQLVSNNNDYTLLSNLSSIYLQTGHYIQAIKYSKRAITVDPYTHIAYFNRFLAYFSLGELAMGWRDLQKALSCLYLLRGFQDSNIRFLNKSIQYCQQNARTYLVRAKLNQGKNNKLVQNDYSAALQYDQNLAEIYQQRALYFRRQNRVREFQEDLIVYKQLKNSAEKNLQELMDNQEQKIDESVNFKQKIEEKVIQFLQLLRRSQRSRKSLAQSAQYEEAMGKLPLSCVQSRIDKKEVNEKKDDDELLLSNRLEEPDSTQTITIKKQEINFKKRSDDFKIDRIFQDIFQDQSSKELNQKISQLQREIQQQGGKIFFDKEDDQLDISDPSNYLTAELQKAIKEIEILGVKQNPNEVRSARSARSNGSMGSKLSEPRELTLEQFSQYQNAKIEIVSLQEIQNYNNKQTAKVELRYHDHKYETQMSKYEWRQQFNIRLNQEVTDIQVKSIQKGGIFRQNFESGEGTINLLETTINKCILANKQKKTAILYYKLTLS